MVPNHALFQAELHPKGAQRGGLLAANDGLLGAATDIVDGAHGSLRVHRLGWMLWPHDGRVWATAYVANGAHGGGWVARLGRII